MNYAVKFPHKDNAEAVHAIFLFYSDAMDYIKDCYETGRYYNWKMEIIPYSEYAKVSFDAVAETYKRHNDTNFMESKA